MAIEERLVVRTASADAASNVPSPRLIQIPSGLLKSFAT